MTTIEQPVRAAGAPVAAPPAPSRRLRRRPSSGHLVMVVAGLLAVVANYAVLRAGDDSVRVAVAAGALEAGQRLGGGDVAFTDVRAEPALLATLVTPADVAAVEGSVVTAALAPGDLVRRADLQAPSAPAAQRAMSIPIEPEHAVAGALAAGDRVDVIEVDGRRAAYLVTGAEVLEVPEAQPAGIAGGVRAFSVTVAVDDTTALRIAVAIRSGQLELVRSTGSAQATTEQVDAGPEVSRPAASHAGADAGGPGVAAGAGTGRGEPDALGAGSGEDPAVLGRDEGVLGGG